MSTEQEKRLFWQQFLTVANQTTDLYQDSAIRKNKHYIHIKAELANLYYATVCKLDESWVEICIQRKHDSEEIYDDIRQNRQVIERQFGESLIWVNEQERQRCKIMTRPVARGRADIDIAELSQIFAEQMVYFHNAINPYLPVQRPTAAHIKKQPTTAKTIIKRKTNKVTPEKAEIIQPDYTIGKKHFTAVESLFKKSMNCRSCFEKGIAIQANIDIAQPRLIGKNYFSATPKIMVVALNPGAGNSADKRKENRVFSQWLYDYKNGQKTVEELFSFQAEYMQRWGTPPGKYLSFYCDGIGLSLDKMAMANIAWCADTNNDYPATMLNDCFFHHTGPLIRLLSPDVIILSGGPTHKFAQSVEEILPGAVVIKTLHYAHRKGKTVELNALKTVRQKIAQLKR